MCEQNTWHKNLVSSTILKKSATKVKKTKVAMMKKFVSWIDTPEKHIEVENLVKKNYDRVDSKCSSKMEPGPFWFLWQKTEQRQNFFDDQDQLVVSS